MKKSSFSALLVAGVIAGGLVTVNQAFAYGAGDIYTRVGIAKVAPKDNNGSLADGTIDVDVKDERGLAFILGYRFHDKLGVELLAALPFEHEIALNGGAIDASTKHLPPTLPCNIIPWAAPMRAYSPTSGPVSITLVFRMKRSGLTELSWSSIALGVPPARSAWTC